MDFRTVYCQRCGAHQFVGSLSVAPTMLMLFNPELRPCRECCGTTFHADHPARRDPSWRQPRFTNIQDVAVLYTLGISRD